MQNSTPSTETVAMVATLATTAWEKKSQTIQYTHIIYDIIILYNSKVYVGSSYAYMRSTTPLLWLSFIDRRSAWRKKNYTYIERNTGEQTRTERARRGEEKYRENRSAGAEGWRRGVGCFTLPVPLSIWWSLRSLSSPGRRRRRGRRRADGKYPPRTFLLPIPGG